MSCDRARLEAHQVVARQQIDADVLRPLVLDDHLVEAGRQAADQVDRVDDLGVLLLGDLGRDEDAEMADPLVERVDDDLLVGADLVDVS